jgi:hypothetical protein
MTQTEALRLALEAFNKLAAWNDGEVGSHMDEPYSAEVAREAITAIKAALEAKDEPVKITHKHEWFRTGEMKVGQMRCISCGIWGQEEMPQRPWVGLTLEEILETYRGPDGSDYVDYARGIEAKLKEKNT